MRKSNWGFSLFFVFTSVVRSGFAAQPANTNSGDYIAEAQAYTAVSSSTALAAAQPDCPYDNSAELTATPTPRCAGGTLANTSPVTYSAAKNDLLIYASGGASVLPTCFLANVHSVYSADSLSSSPLTYTCLSNNFFDSFLDTISVLPAAQESYGYEVLHYATITSLMFDSYFKDATQRSEKYKYADGGDEARLDAITKTYPVYIKRDSNSTGISWAPHNPSSYSPGYVRLGRSTSSLPGSSSPNYFYPLSLDVIANAMARAITERVQAFNMEAVLIAFSDMTGEAAEAYALANGYSTSGPDYLVGAKTFIGSGDTVRSLSAPECTTYSRSPNVQSCGTTSPEVLAGIFDKVFYILATQTPGWDIGQAYSIFFDSATMKWNRTQNMEAAACSVIGSAAALFNSDEQKIRDVESAFSSVGLGFDVANTCTYVPSAADLMVKLKGTTGKYQTITGDTEYGLIQYLISVTNNGATVPHQIQLNNIFPEMVNIKTLVPSRGACYDIDAHCELGELQVGASATINVGVRVPVANKAKKMIFDARVASELYDPNAANNSDPKAFGGSVAGSVIFLIGLLRRKYYLSRNVKISS